ncbi:MATE family efflux transporter [Aliikangiella maris]|uniref:MATE family efflux transporter n=2 Tax=Aliikangiella maris TaxID=3162458 RepID=A0ABV2BPT8_9GAMM
MRISIINEVRQLLPIAIPAVLAQLAQMAMGVIDTVMAGQYSNQALAAIAIGGGLLHPVMIFFVGLFLAFNPIIAHLKGANADDQIGANFRLSLLLGIIISPIAVTILLESRVLLVWLNVDPDTALLASGYVNATAWGLPCFLLFLALRFCNEGLFATAAIMTATVVSIPFNILLNYWFMYGGLGIQGMGAIGVGYATSLVWLIMFIGLLGYTLLNPKYSTLMIFRQWSLPTMKSTVEVFKLGFPMAITLFFEVTMFAAVSLMIARYPTQFVGAHQIALNIASLAFMIPLGMSQAITARVGFFNGRGDPLAAKLAGYTGISVAALLSAFTSTTMIILPSLLVSFYTQDNEVLLIAVNLLFFAAVFQFSDCLQVSSAGALRGVKDSKIPMLITAVSYWLVGFPFGYYMAEQAGLGVNGYWMGLIAGLSTAAVLLLYRWARLSRNLSRLPISN